MPTCDGCPKRLLAMLADEVGAEEAAKAARAATCPWWQPFRIEQGNGVKVGCLAEHLDNHFRHYGGWMKCAVDTIQEDRNEQAAALEKVQAAIEEYGGGAILQALGALGLVTAQSGLQGNARPEALPGAGEGPTNG
jgi:hypothetical protein